jgi:peptide deformylase
MSVPNLNVGPIERPNEVTIEATDLEGNRFIEQREGLNARVSFHENDHLNGVLQIDRLPPNVRKRIEPQLLAIKKKYADK